MPPSPAPVTLAGTDLIPLSCHSCVACCDHCHSFKLLPQLFFYGGGGAREHPWKAKPRETVPHWKIKSSGLCFPGECSQVPLVIPQLTASANSFRSSSFAIWSSKVFGSAEGNIPLKKQNGFGAFCVVLMRSGAAWLGSKGLKSLSLSTPGVAQSATTVPWQSLSGAIPATPVAAPTLRYLGKLWMMPELCWGPWIMCWCRGSPEEVLLLLF